MKRAPEEETLPILEIGELAGDLLDVDFGPGDVVVALDGVEHVVVERVELLHERELLADVLQLGVLGDLQAEELLAARVRRELAQQRVEPVLEDEQQVGRLARRDARHHRTALHVGMTTRSRQTSIVY